MGDTYFTKDLGNAAFLVARGKEIGGTTMENGIVVFMFDSKAECEELEKDYRFNSGTVEARKFYNAIRDLKTMIFRKKENNNVPIK